MKYFLYSIFFLILLGCSKESNESYNSNRFAICNSSLVSCDNIGNYCLFGFKWGDNTTFSDTGVNANGPRTPGGRVTFSLQESSTTVNTHRQVGVPTVSFDNLPNCQTGLSARELILKAFDDWSKVADIQFVQLADDGDSDIKVFVANISTGGVGYPNYNTIPCTALSGHLILSPSYTDDCDLFYPYVLHELGHVLGLGHSSASNVMGSISSNRDGLQEGDIKGIQEIYGE